MWLSDQPEAWLVDSERRAILVYVPAERDLQIARALAGVDVAASFAGSA